jgi:hypothetical protein
MGMGMTLLGLAWLFALAIGAPALLGLWSTRLFYGRLDKDADIAALEPAVAKEMGDWVRLSGLFAVAMFLVGIVLGWAECRRPAK